MNWRSLCAAAAAILCCLSLPGQGNCPKERTQTVPANVDYGPKQDCSGFDYRIGDLQLSSPSSACPMFVIHTPEHEVAVSSPNETRVKHLGFEPVTMVSFVCQKTYFLFITLSTNCVVDQKTNLGSVMRLVTIPCQQTQP